MKASHLLLPFAGILLTIAVACGGPAAPLSPGPTKPTTAAQTGPEKSSWQARWDSTVAKARTEGTVVVHTSANPATTQALKEAFRQQFGINIDFIVGRGEESMARIQAERRAGLYLADAVIAGTSTLLLIMKPQGVLQPLKPALILPEVTDATKWRGKELPLVDQTGLSLAFVHRTASFLAANSDAVQEAEIKSYRDLLDPKWKGKITTMDPTISGGGSYWVALMFAIFGQDGGKDYLQQFVKQEPLLIADKRQQVEWLARNKYPLSIAPDVQTFDEFKRAGAPIKWKAAHEGIGLTYSGGVVSLIDRPANPNAAIVFVNWLLTKDTQALFQKNYGPPSARADVDTSGIDPAYVPQEGAKLISTDSEEQMIERPKLIQLAKEIFRPVMQK